MSTDASPEIESRAKSKQPRRSRKLRPSSLARWWQRGLVTAALVAVAAPAATLIPAGKPSQELGPKLTHTIARGDLVVTVTERGILESAENVEVKCEVRGRSTVIWVIEGGSVVEPGDELVRLDTLAIQNAVDERTKYALWSRSSAERSKATVATAELAVSEYLEGRYRTELMTLEKNLAIAETELSTARNMSDHAQKMGERGYVSEPEVEEKAFAVTQAELGVDVMNTQLKALKDFDKKMELETLRGNLKAAKANLAAGEERAKQDAVRRDEALEELELCVIKAEKAGMVIHPSALEWETGPRIEEGSTVHMDQVLLLMPDLERMQVKLGIKEAVVDRVQPGQSARVTLPEKTLVGQIDTVASVTRQASVWTGNEVLYETIISLPSVPGLKPGMSAEVEVMVARHTDVITIPVAAVLETAEGDFCWVHTSDGPRRRSLELGETNDIFTIVKAGLAQGDRVMLNPLALADESLREAVESQGKPKSTSGESPQPEADESKDAESGKPAGKGLKKKSRSEGDKPEKPAAKETPGAAAIIKLADKNGDGVLSIDEFDEKNRKSFPLADTNKDGKVDAAELEAALERLRKAKSK